MKRFAALYEVLDQTASTNEKVAAMAAYFAGAPAADAAWAVFFLTGRRLKRLLPPRLLAGWAMEAVGVPEWLFEESYGSVGDLAETIALLLDARPRSSEEGLSLAAWVEERVLSLKELPEEEQRARVLGWWSGLDRWQTFVLNKILTGELRVGVSQTLVERALAQAAGLDPATVARRLIDDWEPGDDFFRRLLSPGEGQAGASLPDPSRLDAPPELAVDAVLIYAGPGPGGRSLLTEYTFAVWSGAELVPFAKASTGLSDAEIVELDHWIRRHTVERFGPVRAVEPLQVFEVAFEGIAPSRRHRSGLAVRSPRIARWRTDKTPGEAATLEGVQALIGNSPLSDVPGKV